MAARSAGGAGPAIFRPVRCRCGHLPTHHMHVAPVPGTASFRLDPSGPCGLCGEGVCRRYAPGGDAASALSRMPA